VRIVGSGEYTHSGASGINGGDYCLVGLESGDRKVRVSAARFEPYETPSGDLVKLVQGKMATRDFRLKRQSRV
jgi:hypothetical protein